MYLVTGATGFVGRHLLGVLCPLAAREGHQVYVLCRSQAGWQAEAWAQAYTNVTVVQGDVTDVAAWQHKVQNAALRGIFHLAAVVHHSRQKAAPATHINVEGTRQIVRLGRELGVRTVFMSSSGTVGCSPHPEAAPTEVAPFCEAQVAGWPYYKSKVAAERAARAEAPEAHQLVIVRPPVILGPGDHRFRSTGNVVRLLRGKLPFSLPGGMHFVDVRDVATALLAAMLLPNPRPVYHLPGHAEALQSFFTRLARLAACRPPRFALPTTLGRLLARADQLAGRLAERLGAPAPHLFVDEVVVEMGSVYWNVASSCAHQDLHYAARPADDTLRDTVAWIRNHRADCGPASNAAPTC